MKNTTIIFLTANFLCFQFWSNAQTVTPWLTTGSKSILLQAQTPLNFAATTGSASTTININPATTYQTMDGFGFCLTEGSAEVISTLSTTQQDALLTELFDKTTGLGISVLRISIGASDLSSSDYSYNETSGDLNMVNFSLAGPDLTYLIPILKKALAINPDIKILATPWTAPRWMKTNNAWVGGSLNTLYYAAYANYFVKYIDAMKGQGVNIWGITPQNEPENPYNEPSLVMTSTEQKNFINYNLGPAMVTAGHSAVKIIAFDHNCDNASYPIDVCNSSSFVDGAAFHLYAGNISTMTTVKNATGKNVYFTEQYTGSTGDFSGDLGWHLQNVVIGSGNNWAKAIIEWNLANNASIGPHTPGGCSTCLGAITINNSSTYTRNVSYYIIGQISKFVKAGAVRIGSTISGSNITATAYKNPDETISVVTYNGNSASQTIKIVWNSQSTLYTIPGASAATFVWNSSTNEIPDVNSNQITLSPNPGTNILTLKLTDNPNIYKSVSFTTAEGKMVLTQSIQNDAVESTINVSGLSAGVYIVRMIGMNGFQLGRFIKL
ncbi:MAG: glycoside hydrolase family 30 beta sandwich domain-containing protein [Paludibacter sp.]